ncbi:hypothetical protein QTH97_33390 [Variovorax sp. J22R24]|uniref:hypothetical protein n=1 Tax=Variovorax gracilis TaxID=3053502 RepID=UPI002575C5C8|nr:hypothetical protein [Variovorax sp. J22R24]MDM0109850.1 hypothetical protein [Variovorax sp. J22R24]
MTDQSRLSVGLYIAAASLHERRFNDRKPAPAKAFGANRIKLHEKDDHPNLERDVARPSVVGNRN